MEFLAGTNPASGSSIFAVKLIPAGNQMTLSWPSVPGKTYTIQTQTTLSAGWSSLISVPAAASPATVTSSSVTPSEAGDSIGFPSSPDSVHFRSSLSMVAASGQRLAGGLRMVCHPERKSKIPSATARSSLSITPADFEDYRIWVNCGRSRFSSFYQDASGLANCPAIVGHDPIQNP